MEDVCRIMVPRKSVGYLEEEGVWRVRSDSIALKILRMSARKEEKWSFQTISRPVPRA